MFKRLIAIVTMISCSGLLALKPAHGQSSCPEPSGSDVVENYCYDSLGRLIAQRRNDGTSETLEYDDAGNRTNRVIEASANIVIVIISGRPIPIVIP